MTPTPSSTQPTYPELRGVVSRRPLLLGLSTLGLLTACGPAVVDMPFDGDQDGLMDLDEQDLGTDATNPDTDGDGFLDGWEVNQGADPLDAAVHPYTGLYEIDPTCRDTVKPTGNEVGDVAEDFALLDQFGEEVHLIDFCRRTILLEYGGFT